jgi:uncharacterized protein YggE
MKSRVSFLGVCILSVLPAAAQTQETKFIADTIVVQADGKYEADPDLATVTFSISTQEKELRRAYDKAAQSMQHILQVARQNGLREEEISRSALAVIPFYSGDPNKRNARSYRVESQVTLRVRDFSKIGPLLDDSIQEGIVELRSLTYSLADEEAAKERAVADAMRRAVGRAAAALEQKGQKLGALRYANLDVKQMVGVARMETMGLADMVQLSAGAVDTKARQQAVIPMPAAAAERITVTATVQCIFQIQ